MTHRLLRGLLAATATATFSLAPMGASATIDIVFDYTYDTGNFFADPQKRAVLDAAAAVFETRLLDNLGAITSGGGLNFTASFFDLSNPSAPDLTVSNFSVAANTITVFAGASSQLGSGTLGVGGPGGFGLNGSGFGAVSRGQAGYTPIDGNASNDTDFAPWGGAISFSSTATWYYGLNHPGTGSSGANDFYSVAVHELAHLLGMGTASSWDNRIVSTNFVGTNSGTVALSPDRGHWANGTTSLVDGLLLQEAAMDPSILTGTRKLFTDLDWNGMRDIGWEVSPVPEPGTQAMLLAGLLGLAWLQRRPARWPARRPTHGPLRGLRQRTPHRVQYTG